MAWNSTNQAIATYGPRSGDALETESVRRLWAAQEDSIASGWLHELAASLRRMGHAAVIIPT